MLNYLFKQIKPEGKNTWLSVRFNRWHHLQKEKRKKAFKTNHNMPVKFFDVPGAGAICISEDIWVTGGAAGFDFSVDWSDYPFCGGVLGLNEAKRLAEYLLEKCNAEKRTEEEIQADHRKRMDERIAGIK